MMPCHHVENVLQDGKVLSREDFLEAHRPQRINTLSIRVRFETSLSLGHGRVRQIQITTFHFQVCFV
jgi:hypothetical protein